MDFRTKFKFKLASHLGMTVRHLEQTMLNSEFVQWFEYAKNEPLLPDRIELMLAQVASIQSGKPSIDFMVSVSQDDKKIIKHKQMEKDLTNTIRGLKK